jgi:hypothetical protein
MEATSKAANQNRMLLAEFSPMARKPACVLDAHGAPQEQAGLHSPHWIEQLDGVRVLNFCTTKFGWVQRHNPGSE